MWIRKLNKWIISKHIRNSLWRDQQWFVGVYKQAISLWSARTILILYGHREIKNKCSFLKDFLLSILKRNSWKWNFNEDFTNKAWANNKGRYTPHILFGLSVRKCASFMRTFFFIFFNEEQKKWVNNE